MKIEIKRFKVKFQGRQVIVDAPHEDEAAAKVRNEYQLPIGEPFKVSPLSSKFVEE